MPEGPVITRTWRASAPLRPFIAGYDLRNLNLGPQQMYTPLPARSDCFLQFYLADRYRVVTVSTGTVHRAPRAVLVGPNSHRREDLLVSGHLKVFTIRFTSIGFRALFNIPARAIVDVAESADSVLGPQLRELEERIASAPEDRCASIADSFLVHLWLQRTSIPNAATTANMVNALKRKNGALTIAELSTRSGLSVRHIEREFLEHVGLSPKFYARLTRLRTALDLTAAKGAPDWASIAATSGYYDQSHMVREFRTLTGETPARFLRLKERAALFPKTRGDASDVAFVLSPPIATV